MIEYIVIAILMFIILGTLIYYNKKNIPPRSCGNCRFSDKGLCHNEIVMQKCQSDSPIIHGTNEIPCVQWEWNGERDGQ